LLNTGAPARPLLLEAAGSFDPEVRASARRLVLLIDEGDFTRRLEAFAADKNGKKGLTLPGWEAFRTLIGDDPAARNLFVEIQRHEGDLLAQVFDEKKSPLDTRWEQHLARFPLWQTAGQTEMLPLGRSAAMLLLATTPQGHVSDLGVTYLVQMIQQPPLREAIRTGPHHNAIRRLLTAWLVHCPNTSEESLKQRLGVASIHELREALPLALAVAHDNPDYLTVHPLTRTVAVLVVGQLGGPEHVENLEPLLADDTVALQTRAGQGMNPNGPAALFSVQVRDVALVTMLHLTGQNPADYGYVNAVRQPHRLFNLQTLFMENDQQRSAAAEKWQQWKKTEGRTRAAGPLPAEANTPKALP